MPRGKPFAKGGDDRQAQKSAPGKAGRKKTPPEWKEMADELRLTIVRLLDMKKQELKDLILGEPTGVEMLAAKYITEHPIETVNRFLGKNPDVVKSELTGKDGAPLQTMPPISFAGVSPKDLDRFIKAAEARVRAGAPGPDKHPAKPPAPGP